MRSLALILALALPSAVASAAPTTADPHPSTIITQSHKARWVRMSFTNQSLQGRLLTVGENSYLVLPGETVKLDVKAGSTLLQTSPWNSRVNSQMVVTASDDDRTVLMR